MPKMENTRIKDRTKKEFKEYKKQKERERRMKMSEEKKDKIRFKD
jgi:hypothetical protein